MERSDAELITAVLNGDEGSFEPLIQKYSPRVFATARRYARRDSEVEDIVQEIWIKAFDNLKTFRGEAPFEHWLMRLAVRICYDFLRRHQRNRESAFSEISEPETDWLERFAAVVASMPEIVDAWRMSGDVDYLLHVVVADIAAYDDFYRRLIAAVPLRNVSSRFAMERLKAGALPI